MITIPITVVYSFQLETNIDNEKNHVLDNKIESKMSSKEKSMIVKKIYHNGTKNNSELQLFGRISKLTQYKKNPDETHEVNSNHKGTPTKAAYVQLFGVLHLQKVPHIAATILTVTCHYLPGQNTK